MKEANYLIEHNDRSMRDFFVLKMNSDRFQKDCFKGGNAFTFKDVRDIAKSEAVGRQTAWVKNITGLGRFC